MKNLPDNVTDSDLNNHASNENQCVSCAQEEIKREGVIEIHSESYCPDCFIAFILLETCVVMTWKGGKIFEVVQLA